MTYNRHLKVTPIDLRQARFKSAIRGFDRVEVTTLLIEVADDYENALRENDRLREELIRLETTLTQYRELEGGLKTTLASAYKVSEDMRETANLEAARIVRDAETRAEMTLQKAHARLADVSRDIDGLRMKQHEVETGIESSISVLRHALERVREQTRREDEHDAPPAVESGVPSGLLSDALQAKAYRELATIAAQAESMAALNADARSNDVGTGAAADTGSDAASVLTRAEAQHA
jgi:cell division initiation protein